MSGVPSAANQFLADHVNLLCESYERLIGHPLGEFSGSSIERARAVFAAPYAVLSSGLEADPLFNYANRTALGLFELDWPALISLPARESAETVHQDARERLMQQVRERGYIEDYAGIRISASGRRFMIERATVWNIIDDSGRLHGQAATFAQWRDL